MRLCLALGLDLRLEEPGLVELTARIIGRLGLGD
jgi:hypothetical protein